MELGYALCICAAPGLPGCAHSGDRGGQLGAMCCERMRLLPCARPPTVARLRKERPAPQALSPVRASDVQQDRLRLCAASAGGTGRQLAGAPSARVRATRQVVLKKANVNRDEVSTVVKDKINEFALRGFRALGVSVADGDQSGPDQCAGPPSPRVTELAPGRCAWSGGEQQLAVRGSRAAAGRS